MPNKKSAVLFDVASFNRKNPSFFREDLDALMGHLSRGEINPLIAAQMPMSEASQAQEMLLGISESAAPSQVFFVPIPPEILKHFPSAVHLTPVSPESYLRRLCGMIMSRRDVAITTRASRRSSCQERAYPFVDETVCFPGS
jgi:hypothetical protein